jgi:hypothetical protein
MCRSRLSADRPLDGHKHRPHAFVAVLALAGCAGQREPVWPLASPSHVHRGIGNPAGTVGSFSG